VLSAWVLRRFYFPRGAAIVTRLRLAAVALEVATLGLFFLPFLPEARGGLTGWGLAAQGQWGIVVFLMLAVASTGLFLTKHHFLLKSGAVVHVLATILFFGVIISIFPETLVLTLRDIAPIIISLLMLTNMLVAFLLWHQLQKSERSKI
jgi:hypothetical protein